MHKVTITPAIRGALGGLNCWDVRIGDVEKLANLLIGNLQIPVLRRGNQTAIVGGQRCGGAPNRFGEEFRRLARECTGIFDGSELSAIYAAAYYHRRFEAIHPLVDFNGRVGRLLMAEQLRRTFLSDVDGIQDALIANEPDYRAIRGRQPAQEQFERLVRLLARVMNRQIAVVPPCPYPLSPVFPESEATLKAVMKSRPGNSVAVKPGAFRQRISVTMLNQQLKRADNDQTILEITKCKK